MSDIMEDINTRNEILTKANRDLIKEVRKLTDRNDEQKRRRQRFYSKKRYETKKLQQKIEINEKELSLLKLKYEPVGQNSNTSKRYYKKNGKANIRRLTYHNGDTSQSDSDSDLKQKELGMEGRMINNMTSALSDILNHIQTAHLSLHDIQTITGSNDNKSTMNGQSKFEILCNKHKHKIIQIQKEMESLQRQTKMLKVMLHEQRNQNINISKGNDEQLRYETHDESETFQRLWSPTPFDELQQNGISGLQTPDGIHEASSKCNMTFTDNEQSTSNVLCKDNQNVNDDNINVMNMKEIIYKSQYQHSNQYDTKSQKKDVCIKSKDRELEYNHNNTNYTEDYDDDIDMM